MARVRPLRSKIARRWICAQNYSNSQPKAATVFLDIPWKNQQDFRNGLAPASPNGVGICSGRLLNGNIPARQLTYV
jgi:hypothetical protein